MKILILTCQYPPLGASGHDMRCQQVATALSLRGHRLQVLASNYRLPPMGIDSDKGVFRELNLSANLSDEDYHTLSYQDILSLEQKNAATLDYRLARFRPDMVLVWDCAQLSKSLLMCVQQQGIPMAFDLHNEWLSDESFQADPWRWWWRSNRSFSARFRRLWMTVTGAKRSALRKFPVYDPADLDISRAWLVSQSLRATLNRESGADLSEIPVVYPALNPGLAKLKTNYTTANRFMWAGRLSAGKAPELALEAIALLKDAGVPVKLDLYGMGEPLERKVIRERIDSMKLGDCVKVVALRPGEISAHYAKYSALLFTSRCDDPLPMTPVEAMLSGLPCILSRDGGIQELVTDGETALLFDRDDVQGLVDAIQRFLALPDLGAALARVCTQRLREMYSMDIYQEKVDSLLISGIDAGD